MLRKLTLLLALFVCIAGCKKDNGEGIDKEKPEPPIISSGVIETNPLFPEPEQMLTIIYNASKGNKALMGFTGDIYIYAGANDWKYVKSKSFNEADPLSKMTSIGGDRYKISFNPRKFFNIPPGEKIFNLTAVFRNERGSISGKTRDNSDICIPVYVASELNVKLISPSLEYGKAQVLEDAIFQIGSEVTFSAASSKEAELILSIDGKIIGKTTNTKSYSVKVPLLTSGTKVLKIVAHDGAEKAEQTFVFTVNGNVKVAELPANVKDGVTYINGGRSVVFNLYAPNKKYAYVIGTFNDWKAGDSFFMNKTPDGKRWWLQVDNINAEETYGYQFWVDGSLKIADPYAEIILDPDNDKQVPESLLDKKIKYPEGKTTGIVSVINGNKTQYEWEYPAFKRPERKDLVIYELHLRDFVGTHSYATLKDTLTYLTRLGVNAIELLPINEFEGNSSWGYNPSFYFAADKYYGTKEALKSLIDECHRRGIAVIMDMVLNHSFGQSPMVQLYFNQSSNTPSGDSPWFNTEARHPYNVGYDFNHESEATRYFVKRVLEYWMKEYKVDGFRFDLSKGFTQRNSGSSDADLSKWNAYDASRIAIWKDYNDFIKSIDSDFYVILEHFGSDEEENELAKEGMLLWNNLNYNFGEAVMGWLGKSSLERLFSDNRGANHSCSLVSYMESHDEERLMFKALKYGNSAASYSPKSLNIALERQKMAAAFLFAAPGPKMIWQFGEVGYDVSIEENGRTGEKPILWDYYKQPKRRELFDTYSRLIKMKVKNQVFSSANHTYNLNGAIKHVILNSSEDKVVVIGNFDVIPRQATIKLPQAGIWVDNLSDKVMTLNSDTYSGLLQPGEFYMLSTRRLKY